MIDIGDLRCDPSDLEGLMQEIRRRDRIIEVLVQQAERGYDPSSGPTLLQANAILEDLVRKRTSDLVRSVEDLERFVINAPIGIVFTRNHIILRHNAQFARIFGFSNDEAVGKSTRILFRTDQEFESAKQRAEPVLSLSKTHSNDVYMRHANGTEIFIHAIGYSINDSKPGTSSVWMIEDRTAIKISEDALNKSNQELKNINRELIRRENEISTILENAHDAYISCTAEGILTGWNRQAEITFGWRANEVIGRMLHEVCIPQELWSDYFENLRSGIWVNKRLEHPALYRDGTRFTIELRVGVINFGESRTFFAFLHDISERKSLEKLIEFEANHDLLTGLPNRRGLYDKYSIAMAHAKRSRQGLAILFIDLDGFKGINDKYGHDAGDLILKEVGKRLSKSLRETDFAARLAGDEFIVVLEHVNTPPFDAQSYADKLIKDLSRPVLVGNDLLAISASIGISVVSAESELSFEDLMQQADKAMYQAKKAGKARSVLLPQGRN